METELFREKIVKEYVKYRKPEKKLTDVWSNDEYIKFYEDNKRSLNFLLLDINEYFVDNKEKIEKESKLTSRQIGCIQRITKTFTKTLYGNHSDDFSYAYYELLDFIFYPEYDLKELSYNEIEIIRMMAAYLISKADEFIKKYKKYPDEYLEKYKLVKTKETSKKIFFNLVVDDNIVGNAWITKRKYKIFKNGLEMYIAPEYRKKRYGTTFYHMLCCEISEMNIEWIYLIIDKNDEVAINFLNKQINKYERRIEKGRKIIFEDTLIVD